LVDLLLEKVSNIDGNLRGDMKADTQAITVCSKEIIPLGPQRLNTVELVFKIV
jgi:hypothetical protein